MKRRDFLIFSGLTILSSCHKSGGGDSRIKIWGGQGIRDGYFLSPRAIGINNGEFFIIDTTGRFQVFTISGTFVRKWSTPEAANGTPTSITFDHDGNVLVPDTHYSRIIKYSRDGKIIQQWGEYGTGDDQFVYPTGMVEAPDGRIYISEYGMNAERVRAFNPDMKFLFGWGGHGDTAGLFNRAMAITMDNDGLLYVADTANNRVQCFSLDGKYTRTIGAGQLKFPEGIAIAPDGSLLVSEYGNHRISRFAKDGRLIRSFGVPGRNPGEFAGPRGVAVSNDGMVFVADTDNHRIQVFPLGALD